MGPRQRRGWSPSCCEHALERRVSRSPCEFPGPSRRHTWFPRRVSRHACGLARYSWRPAWLLWGLSKHSGRATRPAWGSAQCVRRLSRHPWHVRRLLRRATRRFGELSRLSRRHPGHFRELPSHSRGVSIHAWRHTRDHIRHDAGGRPLQRRRAHVSGNVCFRSGKRVQGRECLRTLCLQYLGSASVGVHPNQPVHANCGIQALLQTISRQPCAGYLPMRCKGARLMHCHCSHFTMLSYTFVHTLTHTHVCTQTRNTALSVPS